MEQAKALLRGSRWGTLLTRVAKPIWLSPETARAFIRRRRRGIMLARITKPSGKFLIRDVLHRFVGERGHSGPTSTYLLYGRAPFILNHSGPDTFILDEIFLQHQYDMPHAIRRMLQGRPVSILDLGGNVGYFALWTFVHFPNATLTAFEPDIQNSKRYEEALRLLGREGWRLIKAFAAPTSGTVRFTDGKGVLSARSQDESGIEVQSIDVFPYMEEANLIKMDIEGGEWEVLADPRFSCLQHKAIVLEYHDEFCPAPDARKEVLRVADECGFKVEEGMHEGRVLWLYKP